MPLAARVGFVVAGVVVLGSVLVRYQAGWIELLGLAVVGALGVAFLFKRGR